MKVILTKLYLIFAICLAITLVSVGGVLLAGYHQTLVESGQSEQGEVEDDAVILETYTFTCSGVKQVTLNNTANGGSGGSPTSTYVNKLTNVVYTRTNGNNNITENLGTVYYFNSSSMSGQTMLAARSWAPELGLTAPTKSGATFNGYYSAQSGGNQMIQASGTYNGTNMPSYWNTYSTWYAQYVSAVTLTLVKGDSGVSSFSVSQNSSSISGTTSGSNVTYGVASGVAISMSASPVSGYRISYWKCATASSNKAYFLTNPSSTQSLTITANTTVYVYSSPVTPAITFTQTYGTNNWSSSTPQLYSYTISGSSTTTSFSRTRSAIGATGTDGWIYSNVAGVSNGWAILTMNWYSRGATSISFEYIFQGEASYDMAYISGRSDGIGNTAFTESNATESGYYVKLSNSSVVNNTVTYAGLSTYSYYTIQVKFRKDSSVNTGYDGIAIRPTFDYIYGAKYIHVYNNTVNMPTGASRSGYKFDKWNSNSSGTGTTYTASNLKTRTSNLTLYPIYYSTTRVHICINGGSQWYLQGIEDNYYDLGWGHTFRVDWNQDEIEVIDVTRGETVAYDGYQHFDDELAASGYTFYNIEYGDADGGAVVSIGGTFTLSPATDSAFINLRFYPFVDIVVNNSNYGSVSTSSVIVTTSSWAISTSSNVLKIGGSTVATATPKSQTGYTNAFSKWTDEDGGTLPSTITPGMVITAWFTHTANKYNVSLNPSGGTISLYGAGGAVSTTPTTSAMTVQAQYDSTSLFYTYTLTKITSARTGYTHTGYYTASSGGTKMINATTAATLNQNYTSSITNWSSTPTWYAQWTANSYTVTANANGGSISSTSGWSGTGNTATKSVTYASTYGTLPTVTRANYNFAGWKLGSTSGSTVESSTTVNTASAHTIYATWTPVARTITVKAWTLDINGSNKTAGLPTGGEMHVSYIQVSGNSTSDQNYISQTAASVGYNAHQNSFFTVDVNGAFGSDYVCLGYNTDGGTSSFNRDHECGVFYFIATSNVTYNFFFKKSTMRVGFSGEEGYLSFEDGYFPQSYVGDSMNNTLNGQTLTSGHTISFAGYSYNIFTYNGNNYAKVAAPATKTIKIRQSRDYYGKGSVILKSFTAGQNYWFRVEAIEWHVSDYRASVEWGYGQTVSNLTGTSDMLGYGQLKSDRSATYGTSASSLNIICSDNTYLAFNSTYGRGTVTSDLEKYDAKTVSNKVTVQSSSYSFAQYADGSGKMRVTSLNEINACGRSGKLIFASDLTAMLCGKDYDACYAWTRNLYNLGSAKTIGPGGVVGEDWYNSYNGFIFAHTVSTATIHAYF